MINTLKMNLLIPLQYDKDNYSKTLEPDINLSKEQIEHLKNSGQYTSSEWFHYCFRHKPLEANFQMAESPLLQDNNYKISRVELDSVVRALTGLHKNETTKYLLKAQSDIEFKFGKIRVLFTKSRIAFLHIEIYSYNLSEKETRLFVNAFSQITNSQPRIEYKRKLSKDEEETVKTNLKDIILTLISLQLYVPLSLFDNRISPYIQICFNGDCDANDKLTFFDSIQSLSKRASAREINDSHLYVGKEPYIYRFAGDRTFCIYGDTLNCIDDDNLRFITDSKNGLIKSATENYTTVYAFLLSLQLLVVKNDIEDEDIEYLINSPSRLSNEDNIREFYDKCLYNNGWHLKESISDLKNRIKIMGGNPVKKWIKRWQNRPEINANRYFGKEPYVFISYAHNDKDIIYPIIKKLQDNGIRVWYDKRIEAGDEWPEEIGWNIIDCSLFIIMLSESAVLSINVRNELTMASGQTKDLFGVNIEPEVNLSPGMQLQLSNSQKITSLPIDELADSIIATIKNKYQSVCE